MGARRFALIGRWSPGRWAGVRAVSRRVPGPRPDQGVDAIDLDQGGVDRVGQADVVPLEQGMLSPDLAGLFQMAPNA